ncbi:MAG: tetratricopeptide repeat protein [Dehalococcoidia bacterium]
MESVPREAREHLQRAMALHEQGDIPAALDEARRALERAPDFADARSYLGSTLITRQGRYADGLSELERALESAPEDAVLYYTLGWCYEFVAHRIARVAERPGALDPDELYAKAEASLRRCLELKPEGKIEGDAKDLLSSIIREDVE